MADKYGRTIQVLFFVYYKKNKLNIIKIIFGKSNLNSDTVLNFY